MHNLFRKIRIFAVQVLESNEFIFGMHIEVVFQDFKRNMWMWINVHMHRYATEKALDFFFSVDEHSTFL